MTLQEKKNRLQIAGDAIDRAFNNLQDNPNADIDYEVWLAKVEINLLDAQLEIEDMRK